MGVGVAWAVMPAAVTAEGVVTAWEAVAMAVAGWVAAAGGRAEGLAAAAVSRAGADCMQNRRVRVAVVAAVDSADLVAEVPEGAVAALSPWQTPQLCLAHQLQ